MKNARKTKAMSLFSMLLAVLMVIYIVSRLFFPYYSSLSIDVIAISILYSFYRKDSLLQYHSINIAFITVYNVLKFVVFPAGVLGVPGLVYTSVGFTLLYLIMLKIKDKYWIPIFSIGVVTNCVIAHLANVALSYYMLAHGALPVNSMKDFAVKAIIIGVFVTIITTSIDYHAGLYLYKGTSLEKTITKLIK